MTASQRLAGRRALITGASRGLGAAAARAYVAEGAAVVLAHEPTAERAAQSYDLAKELTDNGGKAVAIDADLSDPAAVGEMVGRARAEVGALDILVNNAAASGVVDWRDITIEQWDYVQHVNVRAPWLATKAAYPDLRDSEHASVINLTSVMVETGQPDRVHYTASKAAIIGMTRALARELGNDAIRVNAIMPGAIRLGPPEAYTEAQMESMNANQALKQPGLPPDLAGTYVFLASDESAFMTGQVINVDGGWVHY